MNCIRCLSDSMDERERDGVVIDVCRLCRGVWLDRGELEKIIARSTRELDEEQQRSDRSGDDDRNGPPSSDRRGSPGRKRSWWQELLD